MRNWIASYRVQVTRCWDDSMLHASHNHVRCYTRNSYVCLITHVSPWSTSLWFNPVNGCLQSCQCLSGSVNDCQYSNTGALAYVSPCSTSLWFSPINGCLQSCQCLLASVNDCQYRNTWALAIIALHASHLRRYSRNSHVHVLLPGCKLNNITNRNALP